MTPISLELGLTLVALIIISAATGLAWWLVYRLGERARGHIEFLHSRIIQLEQMVNAQAVAQLEAVKIEAAHPRPAPAPLPLIQDGPLLSRAFPPPYDDDSAPQADDLPEGPIGPSDEE